MIKILFLASNPIGTTPLDLKKEFDEIRAKLAKAGRGDLFEVAKEDHTSVADLHQYLFNHKPHIVHFSGHGNERGEIVVRGRDGGPAAVDRDALITLFRTFATDERRLACVVLNACFTAGQAQGIAESVPCVIGMSREIQDASAIDFAVGFYRAVGYGFSVKAAFDYGRNQIELGELEQTHSDRDLPELQPGPGIDPSKYIIRDRPMASITRALLHGKYCVVGTRGPGLISRADIGFDIELERRVLIKTLIEPAAREAFEREAREFARVAKHPNIVSIYGAWLHDDPAHYVREFIEGHSLRDELYGEGRAPLPIDFVHEVLAALGDVMSFAMREGVWDLGIEPEKVLIRKRDVRLNRGVPHDYSIVILPAAGGSEYIRDVLPGRLSEESRLYVPPEYFRQDRVWADLDRANQYRLGILGYEMLLGSETFRELARSRPDPSIETKPWPPIRAHDEKCRCPSFLGNAIERMIEVEPDRRYESLGNAVGAIAHRDLHVEVARDSFIRILSKGAKAETDFFEAFYTRLVAREDIRRIFERAGFPSRIEGRTRGKGRTTKNWPSQFALLKEAIVLLFAHSYLPETNNLSILARVVEKHKKLNIRTEYYEYFKNILVETAVEFDKGNTTSQLQSAWQMAIEKGLHYLKHPPEPAGAPDGV